MSDNNYNLNDFVFVENGRPRRVPEPEKRAEITYSVGDLVQIGDRVLEIVGPPLRQWTGVKCRSSWPCELFTSKLDPLLTVERD